MEPKIHESAIELIGKTPMVHLNRLREDGAGEVFLKMESRNPGGSVKDRAALAMIEEGERSGKLRPGGTIVEPTAGNTGIGIALIAAIKGYRAILVVPERFAREKVALMRALGGEVVRTPPAGGMHGAIERARGLVREIEGAWMPQQYENPENPAAHYRTTGPEIYEQMDGRLDAIVIGAGTGGSLAGAGRYLKERLPGIRVVLVEPVGSVFGGGEYRPYAVEGIGSAFVPAVCDMSLVDSIVSVRDEDSFATARALARREGLMVGGSTGGNVFASMGIARELGPGTRTVTLATDGADRYHSKGIFDAGGAELVEKPEKAEKAGKAEK